VTSTLIALIAIASLEDQAVVIAGTKQSFGHGIRHSYCHSSFIPFPLFGNGDICIPVCNSRTRNSPKFFKFKTSRGRDGHRRSTSRSHCPLDIPLNFLISSFVGSVNRSTTSNSWTQALKPSCGHRTRMP
jgi:hypothetical protein